ncbi:hypothetical protein AAHE18_12G064800 [Arachis hypogaea]
MPMSFICLFLKPSPLSPFYITLNNSPFIPYFSSSSSSFVVISSSSEETDRSSYEQAGDHQEMGTGRSYECVFCKRGFTTAQALGGHMNIHRKDRANNKAKIPASSSSKVDDENYYADLGHYSSPIPSYLARNGNYHHEVENNNNNNPYLPIYFPPHTNSHHVQYNEILCVENQRENGKLLFGQDWRQRGNNLSLYTNNNPICVHENNNHMIKDKGEDGGLDLELRLGHYP